LQQQQQQQQQQQAAAAKLRGSSFTRMQLKSGVF
jgi:hypothetical protein